MQQLELLIQQSHDGLDEVGQAIAELMEGIDAVRSARVLEGVRACMTTINSLYKHVDLVRIQLETDIVERSHGYIDDYQSNMEIVFSAYAQGHVVTVGMVQAFAVAWMDFRSSQNDLLDYIEQHPDLEVK